MHVRAGLPDLHPVALTRVQICRVFALLIDLKTAKALGFVIPALILARPSFPLWVNHVVLRVCR